MTKEKKVALALTGVMLFGATTTSLTGCKTKEKQETGISVSETSIDTKDIVVIDTYNPNVLSNGMEGRYVIMYKIWTEHSEELDLPNNKSQTYIYRDVKNNKCIGMFTEYEDGEAIFAYGPENLGEFSSTILVDKTNDKSWYGSLSNLIAANSLKIAYEIDELLEIYDKINEGYIEENQIETYNDKEKISYTFKLN